MGIPAGGYLGRIFSDALAATFSENWIITWTVSGTSRWHITCAVVKRTFSTVMPLIGLILVSLTGSAVAVEKVFAIPGLGRATLDAGVAQDLPALIGPLFCHAMLRLPGSALALATLGFLGLGASPSEPEWGRVLVEGMPYLERAYWVVLAPESPLPFFR